MVAPEEVVWIPLAFDGEQSLVIASPELVLPLVEVIRRLVVVDAMAVFDEKFVYFVAQLDPLLVFFWVGPPSVTRHR